MKILVAVPAYVTNDIILEFIEKTIKSIKTSHEVEVVIPVTHCVSEFREKLDSIGRTYDIGENCLAKAWNWALLEGSRVKADYILICNDDIIFNPDAIDNLVKFAEDHPEFIVWTAGEYGDYRTILTAKYDQNFDEHPHFSCFMVKSNFPAILGESEWGTSEPQPGLFDENFKPAYFEDGDMHNRIIRSGLKAAKTGSAIFYHFGSRTIKTDDELNLRNKSTYEKNREYFKHKWGFDPHDKVVSNEDPIRLKYKGPFEK